jgi:hypothetical protein
MSLLNSFLLSPAELAKKLTELRQELTHLPDSLPDGSTFYSFENFAWDLEKEEEYGSVESAVNHAFEITFCPLGRKSGPIILKGQGPGLVAVVDILEQHTKAYPQSAILQKWILDLIAAAKHARSVGPTYLIQ